MNASLFCLKSSAGRYATISAKSLFRKRQRRTPYGLSGNNITSLRCLCTPSNIYKSEYLYKLHLSPNKDVVDCNLSPEDVLQRFDKGIDELCAFRQDSRVTLSQLTKIQKESCFLHVVHGLAMVFHPQVQKIEAINSIIETVKALPIEEQNQHHKDAFLALCNNDLLHACTIWEESLLRNPKDILSIRCAQQTYENIGDAHNVLGVVQRILPCWDASDPGYSRILAMQSYGFQANGLVPEAEETVGRSLNISLDNMLAIDAMAQAYERTSRHREGLRLLNELDDTWRGNTILENQFFWYKALYQAQVGEYGISLLIADHDISEDAIVEKSSILWRLKLYGLTDEDTPRIALGIRERVTSSEESPSFFANIFSSGAEADDEQDIFAGLPNLSSRFDEIVKKYSFDDVFFSPVDVVHRAMAMSGAGQNEMLDDLISTLENVSITEENSNEKQNGMVSFSTQVTSSTTEKIKQFTLPVCKAIRAFGLGNYDETVEIMLPLRASWHQLGTNSTHMDTLELTFLFALVRSAGVNLDEITDFKKSKKSFLKSRAALPGNELENKSVSELRYLALARALLGQRVQQRKLCPQSHLLNAKVLYDTGAHSQADASYKRALDLGMGQGGNNAA